MHALPAAYRCAPGTGTDMQPCKALLVHVLARELFSTGLAVVCAAADTSAKGDRRCCCWICICCDWPLTKAAGPWLLELASMRVVAARLSPADAGMGLWLCWPACRTAAFGPAVPRTLGSSLGPCVGPLWCCCAGTTKLVVLMLRRGCCLNLPSLLSPSRQLVLALRLRCGLLRLLELVRPTMGMKTPCSRRSNMSSKFDK